MQIVTCVISFYKVIHLQGKERDDDEDIARSKYIK